MRVFFLIILLSYAGNVPAQMSRTHLSIPYTGIGTYSKNFNDAFSAINNQASLANYKQSAAGIYSERRFLLKELSSVAASIVIPSKAGGIGINAHYSGDVHFNNNQIGLAYARRLNEQVSLGIQFNYNNMRIAGYGNHSTVTFEIGGLWQVTQKIRMGLHVYNPVGGKFGKQQQEKLPAIYTMGMGYEASDNFFIGAEIIKEENQPVAVNAGMQYQFSQQFFARAVVSAATGQFAAGLGLKWKRCKVELISSRHQQLGFTPALILLFHFKNKTE
jgi:hypothetical protein